jgi:hypothetical protein
MTIRAHRLVAAGSLAVAALAAPIAIALTSAEPSGVAQCRAYFGNIEDNVCLDGDSGNSFTIGTPQFNGGNGPDAGFTTGPLLPGQTWNVPIG